MTTLTGKTLKKEYVSYIVPSIASQLIFTTYSMVDSIFVARGVSSTALAAVNISSPFIAALFGISITSAVGTSTVVARLKGEGNDKGASSFFSMNLTALTIFSLIFTAAVFIFMSPLCDMLGATENTKPYIAQYISWIAPFSIFFIVSYNFEILLATDGYPAKATKIVTVGVISNCIMDYLFIFVFDWGIMGAALATALSQVIVVGLYLVHFFGPLGTIKFAPFKMNLKKVVSSIYRGLPAGVMEISPGFITLILVHFISTNLGEKGLISFSSMAYIAGVLIIAAVGIGQGTQPLLSYYNGKKDGKSIRTLFRYEVISALVAEVVVYCVICLLSKPIVGIFLSKDAPELIGYTAHMMRFYLTFCVVDAFVIIVATYFTALEKPMPGVIITGLRCTVLLYVSALIVTKLFGPEGVWFSMLLTEVFSLTLAIIMFKIIKIKTLEEEA